MQKIRNYDQSNITEVGNAKGQTPNFYTYLSVGGNGSYICIR